MLDLEALYTEYAVGDFIDSDPIQIPHRFQLLQDIEIAGFFAAIFAWGQRQTIINKTSELMDRMDNAPFEFIQNYSGKSQKAIKGFKHRTFNEEDFDFFATAFQRHYMMSPTLETAFLGTQEDVTIRTHLKHFYNYIIHLGTDSKRSQKHISTPAKKSACKRLCMYLRWMVRDDEVDLGLWKSIKPSQLIVPLDVHVWKVAAKLGWVDPDSKPSWETAEAITNRLKLLDANDPVKYDLALFGIGQSGRF